MPLNLTIGVPLSKLVPFIVTTVLQDPELGEKEDIVGTGPVKQPVYVIEKSNPQLTTLPSEVN
jgi:hypothetical protein